MTINVKYALKHYPALTGLTTQTIHAARAYLNYLPPTLALTTQQQSGGGFRKGNGVSF